ncbi:hypothetical protein MF622_09515 [Paenibacillus polymyxa]|nr:hypothetical protein [Paenibacillus polymyxa]WDZ55718.1 hypothetical protein MF622_09515 [Paenibacillus polymyxa]
MICLNAAGIALDEVNVPLGMKVLVRGGERLISHDGVHDVEHTNVQLVGLLDAET